MIIINRKWKISLQLVRITSRRLKWGMSPWILTCCSGDAIWWIFIWKMSIWTHFSMIGKNKAHAPSDIAPEVGGICSVGWSSGVKVNSVTLSVTVKLSVECGAYGFWFSVDFLFSSTGESGSGETETESQKGAVLELNTANWWRH